MEPTRKILNVAIAFAIVMLSTSAFVLSVKFNTANAKLQQQLEGYVPVGIYVSKSKDRFDNTVEYISIIGFNARTKQITSLGSKGTSKVLAVINYF